MMFNMIPFNNSGHLEGTLETLLTGFNKRTAASSSSSRTSISEEEDRYVLQIELPGYRKDDIEIELEEDYLTVSAEAGEDNQQQLARSGNTGYKQTYKLNQINKDEINAEFHEGLLIINLPKAQPEQPDNNQTIDIN